MSGWVWTPKPDTPLQDSLYLKKPLLNKLHRMRTQWTAKGNWNAGSCSWDRGLQRYLRNFGGGGLKPPNHPPLGTPLGQTAYLLMCTLLMHLGSFLALCSEMHKVCSLVSEHIASQWRIQRAGIATEKCKWPTLKCLRNKDQQDALFFLIYFNQISSTCFE